MSTATARARRPLPPLKIGARFKAVVVYLPSCRIVDSIGLAAASDKDAARVNAIAKRMGDRNCKAVSVPVELAFPTLK